PDPQHNHAHLARRGDQDLAVRRVTATAAAAATAFVRDRATWYAWLLSGGYLFLVNVQGNVVPFLQEQFDLSYRDVSLHSSAIAIGTILVGLFGERVTGRLGRRRSLW